jgi:hypothetical protein
MANFDKDSTEMRRINRAYWEKYMQLASADYISKINGLATFSSDSGGFHCDNTVHGTPEPNHIIYKLGPTLMSADGAHGYEFVVEYDRYQPNVGIYFGAKSLIFDTANAESQIEIVDREWEQIRQAVMLALSNIYPDGHFNQLQRYKLTDNANNFTYWPFWIVLHEQEPIEIAGHAVTVIRKLYEMLLAGNRPNCRLSQRTPQHRIEAAFTNAAHRRLINAIIGKETTRATEITDAVNSFIRQLLDARIIVRSTIFEHAYCLKNIDMTDFAFLIVTFIESLSGGNAKRTPWQCIVDLFLSADMRRMDNLKRLYGAPAGAARRKAQRNANELLQSLIARATKK